METSFLDLRCKEVINIIDGRLLGHIVDMVIDIRTSRVTGLVVPVSKGFFNLFKPTSEIFIPYKNICKIGDDVILVEMFNLPQVKKPKDVCILEESHEVDEKLKPISPQSSEESIRNRICDDRLEK